MFKTLNAQVSSTAPQHQTDGSVPPVVKTSTVVANRLASQLWRASPAQLSLVKYLSNELPFGKKPNHAQLALLGLRRIATQMRQIEMYAAQNGKQIRPKDSQTAASHSITHIDTLLETMSVEDRTHPSFRNELIEHLENIVNWDPRSSSTWGAAYQHLLSTEYLTIKGKRCDADVCLAVLNRLTERQKPKYSPIKSDRRGPSHKA